MLPSSVVPVRDDGGMSDTRYWVGVASRDHVDIGRAGGFCQLSHGKRAPVARMRPGDWIIYYSPRTAYGGGEPLQAFTAIGHIRPGEPYAGVMGGDFRPVRRDVDYLASEDAPIRPMLDKLAFTRGRSSWGQVLRRGVFEIDVDDFRLIAAAMGVSGSISPADL